jgi:nicotinic acid phosphoribosyltransferase
MSATAESRLYGRLAGHVPDANDPGLLSPAQTSLLTDQYELAMASSYLGRGMNGPAVFELFARHRPARPRWLLVAGLGPVLAIARERLVDFSPRRHHGADAAMKAARAAAIAGSAAPRTLRRCDTGSRRWERWRIRT